MTTSETVHNDPDPKGIAIQLNRAIRLAKAYGHAWAELPWVSKDYKYRSQDYPGSRSLNTLERLRNGISQSLGDDWDEFISSLRLEQGASLGRGTFPLGWELGGIYHHLSETKRVEWEIHPNGYVHAHINRAGDAGQSVPVIDMHIYPDDLVYMEEMTNSSVNAELRHWMEATHLLSLIVKQREAVLALLACTTKLTDSTPPYHVHAHYSVGTQDETCLGNQAKLPESIVGKVAYSVTHHTLGWCRANEMRTEDPPSD